LNERFTFEQADKEHAIEIRLFSENIQAADKAAGYFI